MSREEERTRREILGKLKRRLELTGVNKGNEGPMDSSNQFAVGVRGDGKVIITLYGIALSPEGALNLAAWLSVLADPGAERFERLVQEIKNT